MESFTDRMDNESEYSVTTNRSERSRHAHRRHRDKRRRKGEKSVTIQTPSQDGDHSIDNRGAEGPVTVNMPDDQNWGETNTLLSAATTEVTQLSNESLAKFTKDETSSSGFHDCGYISIVIFALLSYLSPIAFVLLPKIWLDPYREQSNCGTSCKGTLIGMAFKLLILLAASWAIFFRRQRTSMPRIFMFRAVIIFVILLLTVTYWLFFGIWVWDSKETNYEAITNFADSYTNCLLFVHYLSLVLLELRHLQTMYVIEVIRSTDGQRRFYNVGDLSIQRCSVWVLERYYCEFPVYNPALMRIPSRSSRMRQLSNHKFKEYDVDGLSSKDNKGKNRAILAAVARRRDAGHNELYYEEAEYEKRVRKRRARLVAATEDAFGHIRRATEQEIINSKSPDSTINANQASDAIFPALARSLQKYLRTTRQHRHYSLDDILEHLATCVKHDMGPKAFLERYIHPGPYLTYSTRQDSSQWELVSDEPLVNMIKDGSVFRLNQNDYSLIVTVHATPRIRIKEEFVDSSSHRFVMHMQTETSL